MKLNVGIFFGVEDIEDFCRNKLYDVTKIKNFPVKLNHSIVTSIDPASLDYRKGLVGFKAYTYKQKDSLVITINNCRDCWNSNIYLTGRKRNTKSLNLVVDTEQPYPCYMLYYYYNETERVIYSKKEENRWIFYESGTPQPFEKGDTYSEKGPTRKFNYDKIHHFCKNMGFDFEDPDFLTPVSELIYTYAEK